MESIISDGRTILILSLLTVSGMFASAQISNQIFPWVVLSLLLGSISLVIAIRYGQNLYAMVISAVILVLGFRVASMIVPASTVGDDPQKFALWIREVVDAGSVSPITSAFYTDAPLHVLFGAVLSIILDFTPGQAFISFGVLMGVITPIIAVSVIRLVGIEKIRLLALTALLAGITTEAVRRTYWPIPQTTATVFWWLFLFTLLKHIRIPSKSQYGLLLLFTTAIAFTHKLPLPIIVVTMIILLLLIYFDNFSWGSIGNISPVSQAVGVLSLVGTLTLSQWAYSTSLLRQIVLRVSLFFQNLVDSADPAGTHDPTAAVPALPGLLPELYTYPAEFSLYFERAHAIWLLLFAGVAWLVLFVYSRKKEGNETVHTLLAAAAACASLVLFGQVSVGAMNPTRPLLLIEPVLVVLIISAIAVIAFWLDMDTDIAENPLLYGFAILLIFTQIFAPSIAADYTNTPRYYLDQAEVQGGEMICKYADGSVAVDQEQHAFSDCKKFDRISRHNTGALYNANITPSEHSTVLYRHNVDVYLGLQSRWELTWEPSEELPLEYHTIYDNGAVTVYHA